MDNSGRSTLAKWEFISALNQRLTLYKQSYKLLARDYNINFYALRSTDFQNLHCVHKQMRAKLPPKNIIKTIIEHSPLFSGIDKKEILLIADLATVCRFKKGEIIIRGGNVPSLFYYIHQGKVKVFMDSPGGRQFTTDVRSVGETFAEGATLDGKACVPTIQALENTVLITLRREDLISIINRNPIVAQRILQIATQRIRKAYNLIIDLVTATARQRVIEVMVDLWHTYGDILPVSRREIADMSGTTPETSSRIVSQLNKEGIIFGGRGAIHILDSQKLLTLLTRNPNKHVR